MLTILVYVLTPIIAFGITIVFARRYSEHVEEIGVHGLLCKFPVTNDPYLDAAYAEIDDLLGE